MNHNKKPLLQLLSLMSIILLLPGCKSSILTVDIPDESSKMLSEGAGDDYTYYALEELPPEDWDDVSSGTLWICNDGKRPPLIPESIASLIDGGGFLPGTQLQLTWADQLGEPDSSELGINEIIVTIGITYEGCTKAALEAMAGKSTVLLLTETDGMFDGKDRLVAVKFE